MDHLVGEVFRSKSQRGGGEFVFVQLIGRLEDILLDDYINLISRHSCKFLNASFTPKDFKQKIINNYNFDFLKLLNNSLKTCLLNQFYSIEDLKEIQIFKCLIELLDSIERMK